MNTKDIPWYEWLYGASKNWDIISYYSWKILKTYEINSWYHIVMLYKNKKPKAHTIHRLIWATFLWLNIKDKKTFVCHKNDIKSDNRINNLFLWDAFDNMKDCVKKWRFYFSWRTWKLHHKSKAINQYNLEWKLIKTWESINLVMKTLWYDSSVICKNANWKYKTAYNYIWKYV